MSWTIDNKHSTSFNEQPEHTIYNIPAVLDEATDQSTDQLNKYISNSLQKVLVQSDWYLTGLKFGDAKSYFVRQCYKLVTRWCRETCLQPQFLNSNRWFANVKEWQLAWLFACSEEQKHLMQALTTSNAIWHDKTLMRWREQLCKEINSANSNISEKTI